MASELYFKRVDASGFYEKFILSTFGYKKDGEEQAIHDWTMDYPQFDTITFEKGVSSFRVFGTKYIMDGEGNVTENQETTLDECQVGDLEWITWQ